MGNVYKFHFPKVQYLLLCQIYCANNAEIRIVYSCLKGSRFVCFVILIKYTWINTCKDTKHKHLFIWCDIYVFWRIVVLMALLCLRFGYWVPYVCVVDFMLAQLELKPLQWHQVCAVPAITALAVWRHYWRTELLPHSGNDYNWLFSSMKTIKLVVAMAFYVSERLGLSSPLLNVLYPHSHVEFDFKVSQFHTSCMKLWNQTQMQMQLLLVYNITSKFIFHTSLYVYCATTIIKVSSPIYK